MSSDSAQVGLVGASRQLSADPQRLIITEAEQKLLFGGSEEKMRRILKQRRVGTARNTAEISQSEYLPTILRNQHFGGAVATPPVR